MNGETTLNTLANIVAELSKTYTKENYPYPIKELNGNDYVSWQDTARQMNHIFGPLGWSHEVREFQYTETTDGRGFRSTVRLTVFFLDENNNPMSVSRDGVGFSTINTTKSGEDLVDTAVKTAEHDGLSRAAKKFGDAFALFLYDKKKNGGQQQYNNSSSSASSNGSNGNNGYNNKSNGNGGGKTITPKMREKLTDRMPANVVDTLSFDEARGLLDHIAGNGWKLDPKVAAPFLARVKQPASAPNDYPFDDEPPLEDHPF